jgi:Uma2 family endonuclease
MASAARSTGPKHGKLRDGMKLRQPEFHRLYGQYADDVKSELIDGVVYMALPAGGDHGCGSHGINGALYYFTARTPGVQGGVNMTTILGWDSEPQPDALLRILPECGGQTHFNEQNFLVGAPELVCEVAVSSLRIDLGKKRAMYEKYGVQEYLVYDAKDHTLHWFQLPGHDLIHPDSSGIYKSQLFPGLWIDSKALARGDAAGVLATIDTKSAAHKKFVAKLRSIRG